MKHLSYLRSIFKSGDSAATFFIRLLVCVVFIPDGIQKLVFSGLLGEIQFKEIGIPFPDILAPFVGMVEVTCGLLILVGLLTRLAVIPLMVITIVAILSTNIPVLLGKNWWIFHAPTLAQYGFWAMMHEIRTNTSMFFAILYLLIRGAGKCSFDTYIYDEFKVENHKFTMRR